MEKYRVLNIMDTTMEDTNQRVVVVELAEVEYSNFTLPSGSQPYTFGTTGKRFVIDFNSNLTQKIIWSAENEELIELNNQDFRVRNEFKNGINEQIHYHKNVRLLGYEESSTTNYKSVFDDEYKKLLLEDIDLNKLGRKSKQIENENDYSTLWMRNICDVLNETTVEVPQRKGGGKWKPEKFANVVEFIKEYITFDRGIYNYLNDKGLINTGRCPITGQSIDETHFYQIFGRKVYLSEEGKEIAKEIDRQDHIKTFGKEPMSSERKAELRQEIIQKQGNKILSKLLIGAILLFILFKACS